METSSGILLYRLTGPEPEVLIAHMGGPFWAKKDAAAWSIPKGLYTNEEPLLAALREFEEELGSPPPDANYLELGEFRQPSGKRVTVYIAQADFDADDVHSNTFSVEWPPRSGRFQDFPEIDAAAWVSIEVAREKLVKGQVPILDALLAQLG